MANILKKKFNALVKKHINAKLEDGVITYPSAQQLFEIYEMRLDSIETHFMKKIYELESEIEAIKANSLNGKR